jgi:hypothetical protein
MDLPRFRSHNHSPFTHNMRLKDRNNTVAGPVRLKAEDLLLSMVTKLWYIHT